MKKIKNDLEKTNGKKVYIIFNNDNKKVKLGTGKNIYLSKGHIKNMINGIKKHDKLTREMTEDIFKVKLEKKNICDGLKVVEYELKPTGKEFDLNEL